jgi:hypothetical protein
MNLSSVDEEQSRFFANQAQSMTPAEKQHAIPPAMI